MAELERNKVALVRIYQILRAYSDFDHPLTQQDIIDKLADEYNIGMERKAIKRNLTVLESAGVYIEYKKTGCYLAERNFMDSELRLLIDGVLCSKHIEARQTASLINRLAKQSNVYFKSHVKHIFSVNDWNKTNNRAIFYNIEIIDEAIEKKKQIHYDYNKFDIDGNLKKSSEQYVSPYQLILHNQRYYLMAYSEYWKNMVYHRLDHITNLTITDKKATLLRDIKGYENGIDYKKFSTQMPYMYADEPVIVEFIASREILDQIVDWFGNGLKMHYLKDDDTKIHVEVKASPLAMKNWTLQYIDYVEVKGPKDLRDSIAKTLKQATNKYK